MPEATSLPTVPHSFRYLDLTDIHDQVPDEDHPPADRAIDVPEPEAEEDRVVRLVAQLRPEQEEVIPKPVSDPVINPV